MISVKSKGKWRNLVNYIINNVEYNTTSMLRLIRREDVETRRDGDAIFKIIIVVPRREEDSVIIAGLLLNLCYVIVLMFWYYFRV